MMVVGSVEGLIEQIKIGKRKRGGRREVLPIKLDEEGLAQATVVSTVAGEETAQWGRTAATTGLEQRAPVLRDAEENQEEVSAIGFVAERRGKERGLAGARWVSARVGREESCGWFSVRIELESVAERRGLL